MARKLLIGAQLVATLLFITSYRAGTHTAVIAWAVPLCILLLIVVNSIWFSRFTSWLIFALGFAGLMAILSAFTLRWRMETEFSSAPFYKAMLMYALFVYISLGQIKLIGGRRAI
jgi:uncharacterized protein involved in response to NO